MLSEKPIAWLSSGLVVALAAAVPAPHAGKPAAAKPPATAPKASASPAGVQLFQQQCAKCHGVHGEGTSNYPHLLVGTQSVSALGAYIADSMPPGPKKCPKTDAPKVAAYIYDAFYSPIAQERNRPARVALSRLTVRQMRNAIADLVGSFRRQAPAPGVEQGLKADYFKAKRFDTADRIVERTDPKVRFDFGHDGPTGGTFDPHQFSIRWTGGVVAPDTGEYEFVVHSDHSVRLWVNDLKKPLIDAAVASKSDTDHRETIYLVGGRVYPIRLEFSKSTAGMGDTAKMSAKPAAAAMVELAWKQPRQTEETIPARCLLPETPPEDFVLTTPFPPDDKSMGYERGDSVSEEWDDATTAAAIETADYVVAHLRDLAGTQDDPVKLREFCRRFVERATRRPLDAMATGLYIDKQFANAPDTETAVKRVVLLALKSPRFLYREIGTGNAGDPYSVASRLSFALWDSIPDEALLRAAASGALSTREQIAAQATRMSADPRTWYKERDFFLQWLKVDQFPDLTKDHKRFPDFTPEVASDLRTSLDLTLEDSVRGEAADYRTLMLTDKLYLNGRLAKIYGVPLAPDADFQPVSLDPGARAGILTHPYLLASLSYFATSDPIHRGVLLTRNILGRTLQQPPAAFPPLAADRFPDLTTRQRVAFQTKPATCQACHGMINPLGFTLERFDAIGRLRTVENGHTIDSLGSYKSLAGNKVSFTGARDLAGFLAGSDEAHTAFVQKFAQYTLKQPIRAYGPTALADLRHGFEDNGYNIRSLMAAIAVESSLPAKTPTTTAPTKAPTKTPAIAHRD